MKSSQLYKANQCLTSKVWMDEDCNQSKDDVVTQESKSEDVSMLY